jgi:ElaB/YqjD/DUF883 family membrane-anchored ribosome-binding protein
MDEQNFTSEYSNGNEYVNETLNNVKDNITAVKDRVSGQANELKGRLSAQASNLGNQLGQKIDDARGKTSARLRNTSQKIQNLALYMEEHDAKDMSESALRSTQDLIRKHPGKSILAGLILGVLVGRLFSLGRSYR